MRLFLALIALTMLSSCSTESTEERYELKSPCVSAGDSINTDGATAAPCVRRKVNYNLS